MCRIGFRVQFRALSPALTVTTASTKHFGVKVIRYFTVLCINAAVVGSQFQTVTNLKVIINFQE